jgi:heat shock protein HslJ
MLRAPNRFLIGCLLLLGPALANAAGPPYTIAHAVMGVGTAGDSAGGSSRWEEITGQEWSVLELEGRPVLDGTSVTIVFHGDGRVSGNAGTNNYMGVYRRRGPDGLEVSDLGATRMYLDVPAGRMQQETEYLGELKSIDRFTVEDDELWLWEGPDRSIRYTRSR